MTYDGLRPDSTPATAVNIKTTVQTKVVLITDKIPFAMNFRSKSGSVVLYGESTNPIITEELQKRTVSGKTIDDIFAKGPGDIGITLDFQDGLVLGSVAQFRAVDGAMLEFTMDDLIEENPLRQPNYLAQLVERMFCDGAASMDDEDAARSKFRFITTCTSESPSFSELYLQSMTMCQRLDISKHATWVPDRQARPCTAALSKIIEALKTIENNAQSQTLMEQLQTDSNKIITEIVQTQKLTVEGFTETINKTQTAIGAVGTTVIQELGYSHTNYRDIMTSAKKTYDENSRFLENRKSDYKALERTVDDSRGKFDKGLSDWAEKQKIKAIIEGAKAVFAIAGAIGGAVASGGAAAPASAAVVAEAATKVADTAEKASKFAKLVEMLKKLIEKIKKIAKVLEEIYKGGSETFKIIQNRNQVTGLGKQATSFDIPKGYDYVDGPTASQSVDYVKFHMDWEDFRADMTELFETIQNCLEQGDEIDGFFSYRTNISKLILRGHEVLNAQKEMQVSGNELNRAISDAERLAARQAELTNIKDQIGARLDHMKGFKGGQPAEEVKMRLEALKEAQATAMSFYALQRLVRQSETNAMHRHVFIYCHEACSALMYQTALAEWPIVLSATKKVQAYEQDVSKLLKAPETVALQATEPPFTFDTSDVLVFGKEWLWRQMLMGQGRVEFKIARSHPKYTAWEHVRAEVLRAYIQGGKYRGANKQQTIELSIQLGPHVEDLVNDKPKAFYITPAPRTFEYAIGDNGATTIRTDGQFINDFQKDAVAPWLFAEGAVQVDNASDWDFASVTGITLEFKSSAVKKRGGRS